MTDEQPIDTTPPADEPAAAVPSEVVEHAENVESPASARARVWLSQLETMIQNVAREAAPTAREVGAKAAELAAVAAVKAGPIAQKAAVATSEYGQRFAERAQSVAADLRQGNEAAAAEAEPAAEGEPATEAAPADADAPSAPADEAGA